MPGIATRGATGESCAHLAIATTHASLGIQLADASEHLLAQLIGVQPWPDQARLQLGISCLFSAVCIVTSPYLVHIASPAFHTLAHRHMHTHCAAQRQRQLMMQQRYEACRHIRTRSVSPECLISACSVLSADVKLEASTAACDNTLSDVSQTSLSRHDLRQTTVFEQSQEQ